MSPFKYESSLESKYTVSRLSGQATKSIILQKRKRFQKSSELRKVPSTTSKILLDKKQSDMSEVTLHKLDQESPKFITNAKSTLNMRNSKDLATFAPDISQSNKVSKILTAKFSMQESSEEPLQPFGYAPVTRTKSQLVTKR